MSYKLSLLLKRVFLSSLAAITASNSNGVSNSDTHELKSREDNTNIQSPNQKRIDLSPKFLLKMSANNELIAMAHRSHRSHSSHRSHYSSSGGGSGSSGGTNSPKSNSGVQPSYKDNSYGSSKTGSTTLQLGARTLKKGMSGTDVTDLVNILLTKKYLSLEDGSLFVTGTYTFDGIVESAVKKFQGDNNLTIDGICGPTTIYYLKNK